MNHQDILSHVDHTQLSISSSWEDIKKLCDEAVQFQTASVCIPPCYVKQAAQYLNQRIKVCTVIGFPNGYNTTATKVFETKDAINNGADEIDMVINIGMVKEGQFDTVQHEIEEVRNACPNQILKVIIETCQLTQEEKRKLCHVVADAGADYIKTSTGFSSGGATPEDIALMAEEIGTRIKIKAAGGISSLEDAQRFLELGADRLGTSRVVKIVQGENSSGY